MQPLFDRLYMVLTVVDEHNIRDYMQATIDMYGLMGRVVHHEGLSFEFRPTGTPDIVDRDARVKSIFSEWSFRLSSPQLCS